MLRQPRDGPGGNERVADGKRRDEEGTRAGFSCRLSLLGPGRSPPGVDLPSQGPAAPGPPLRQRRVPAPVAAVESRPIVSGLASSVF